MPKRKDVSPLKRRLLRELVRENVDLKDNRLPRSLRPGAQRLRTTLRVLALVLFPAVLLGSTQLITSLQAPPLPAPSPGAVTPARPAAPDRRFGAPEPIHADVLPLAIRRVAIDPGHGGSDFGTHIPQGLKEKDLTLDISNRLARLLAAEGFETVLTRKGDQGLSLAERGALASQAGADIFVSVHVNWIEDRGSRGVETYYLGSTLDPFLNRLAAEENRGSGYSMAEMRRLLDRIYADVRQESSRKLASLVQSSLYHSLRDVNPVLEDRGVKAAPFIVLLTTEMPAILAEVSCLSNDQEAEMLAKPLYRQFIAEALAVGVRSYADAVAGTSRPEKGT